LLVDETDLPLHIMWQLKDVLQVVRQWFLLFIFTYIGVIVRHYTGIWVVVLYGGVGQSGPLFGAFFCNLLGSFAMGFLAIFKTSRFFQRNADLYTAISTGCFGCVTTFSGWQGDANLKLTYYDQADNFLLCLIIGYCVPMACFVGGRHCGQAFDYWLQKCYEPQGEDYVPLIEKEDKESALPSNFKSSILIIVVWAVITVLLLGIILGGHKRKETPLIIAALSGCAGTLIRFLLGKRNAYWPNFPMYTFLANIIGCVAYGLMTVALATRTVSEELEEDMKAVWVLGFAGCLTTVSTFVSEIYNLEPFKGWFYAAVSIFVAQGILLLIQGIYFWQAIN